MTNSNIIQAVVQKEAEYAEALAQHATEERTLELQIELEDLLWEMNTDFDAISIYAS